MKIIPILFSLIPLSLSSAEASIVYSFDEIPAGVELSYSGSLNSTALSFQGNLSADGTFIDILGVPVLGHQLYELENFRPSPLYPGFTGISGRYSASNITFAWNLYISPTKYFGSSAFGETFGFYIFQQSGNYVTWLNLPAGYASGAPINGGMLFPGQTLSSMGLGASETFQVFLPGNQTISAVVAPEPQSMMVLAFAMLGAFGGRRYRSR